MTEALMTVYGNYDQAELDRQYNQSTLVPDNSAYRARKISESKRVRALLDCDLDVSYGPASDEVLDIFPAGDKGGDNGAPIMMFIHGGAWKNGHKDDISYPAESFVARGVTYIGVNFSLVGDVTLDEQIRQNRAALAWLYNNAASFGGDRDRIYVSGHSSGGHVTGMMVVTDWEGEWGLPMDLLKGAVPASGMYDLEPVRLSWRNEYLKLDEAGALRNSSIHHIPERGIPLVMAYGSGELDEFQRQSREFAAAWRAKGHSCELIEMPGLNHFDLNQEFNNPDGPILKATFEMMSV